ncbi:MAG TPA: phosphoribosyltransferase family protein [Pyrinomonadaceae bacterium]|nr:phosphoribosyltransferase family protein [Pyrinomonadaceae bacterium]
MCDTAGPGPVLCHKCDGHFYDRALAAGIYELALAASIIELKSTPRVPRRVADMIRNASQNTDLQNNDVVIPVPLSKLRRIERGFNQAETIAAVLTGSTGMPLDTGSLARALHTPIHRIGMDDKARDLTVRKAFKVERPKLIADKKVLLVDDVFTSGATASHCARILKKHGATRVTVFTLARAVQANS